MPATGAKAKVPPQFVAELQRVYQGMLVDMGPARTMAYELDPKAEKALDMIGKGLAALRQRIDALR